MSEEKKELEIVKFLRNLPLSKEDKNELRKAFAAYGVGVIEYASHMMYDQIMGEDPKNPDFKDWNNEERMELNIGIALDLANALFDNVLKEE